MSPDNPIRVAVVEDRRVTRDGLRLLLDATPGFACAGAFESVEEALAAPGSASPDVVLLDIHLPGMPGSLGVRPLREKWQQAQVVMHTVFEEDEKVFESLCHGAVGYVLKRTPPARLLEAVQEARGGGAPMSPEIARKVVALFRRVAPQPAGDEGLAPQEVRVLAQLAQGASYQDAADALHVSINTVRGYIRNIYQKLHVSTRSEAVSKALRAGLV